ncbi:MAG TPA: YbhB/YbcL family Raf kinase inhibitor-like protein [Tianweitania sediminis]|nr:YbhB/YbcL family Raf kinase inhibitor-like protein [Tianweitania sediminis]
MPKPTMRTLALTTSLLALVGTASAQPQGKVGQYSDVTIQGTILEPEKLTVPGDAELQNMLKAPDGFQVTVFARDLVNPRMLAVGPKDRLYATRRTVGDVILIEDGDGDGEADTTRTVASRDGMHGIAFDGDQVFLVTVNDVYVADVEDDGSFSPLRRIINDLPDAGQHPNRTIAIGPDDMLYISVGSTCNACAESNPENATMLRAKKDGSSRTILAKGLRNTIGFDWQPGTGDLYGIDHGIDWLGDEAQIEEVNLIEKGKDYGWPYIYGMGEINPQDNPPEGVSLEQLARETEKPLAGYTPHSAPMQMAFYKGAAFPEEYRGDAFIAMRGSWNRRPPSGYEVARVRFENDRPVAVEPFVTGFLNEGENGFGYLGRLAGLTVAPDGSMFVCDDSNGVIYRIAYTGDQAAAQEAQPVPNSFPEPTPSELANAILEPSQSEALEVTASFPRDEAIPVTFAADGDNASPAVEWGDAPDGAKSFVLLAEDPDAAQPKPFVHWIVYDIPADVTKLREGMPTDVVIPDMPDVKQGTNSRGSTGYFGPKPPVGDPAHHYHFQVFALSVPSLELDPGAKRDAVIKAMKGKVVAQGEIVGTFARD